MKNVNLQFIKDVSPACAAFYSRHKEQFQDIVNRYGITSVPQIINFVTHMIHESSNFQKTKESMFYTSVERIRKIYPKACLGKSDAELQKYVSQKGFGGKPGVNKEKQLADFVYGSKNGNDSPGDGSKYIGRGYLQLTGKANYRQFGKQIGKQKQILENPQLVETKYFLESAAFFFVKSGCNQLSKTIDSNSIKATTKRINGALTGLDDRKKIYNRINNVYQDNLKNSQNNNKLPKFSNNGFNKLPFSDIEKLKQDLKNMTNGKQNIKNLNNILEGKGNLNIGGVKLKFDLENKRFDGFQMTDDLIWLHSEANKTNHEKLSNDTRLKDLIVPLKIMFDAQIKSKNISVSLDPLIPTEPDGPYYTKVYYPQELEETEFGAIMIEADHIMKQLKIGVDKQNNPFKYPQSLLEVGFSFDQISKYAEFSLEAQRTRQWIIIKDVQIIDVGKNVLRIGKITMGLQAQIQKIGPQGKLIDSDEKLHKDTELFCKLFTQHYELLCKQYPVFQKLKSLAKASIIARQMYLSGCKIDEKLINSLYQFQKTDKSSKIISKLSVTYKKTGENKKIIVEGGCDLSITEELQIRIDKMILKKKEIDQNIPKFDQNQYFPFLFQKIIQCSQNGCQSFCPQNIYALQDEKCRKHLQTKCNICGEFFGFGQNYSKVGEYCYHIECMVCSLCGDKISNELSFTDKEILVHQKCMPKRTFQICSKCEDAIYFGEKYFLDKANFYHFDCFPRQKCDQCQIFLEGQYCIVGNKKLHPACFKCKRCKNPILEQKYGIINGDEPVHMKCL